MSRPLRLEFAGSLWHVTHRGNARRPMFYDRNDYARFLELVGRTVDRFGWIVTAYALMPTDYRLLVELTRDRTLSVGMKWLNGTYAQWFNWRHDRVGHLIQGRFGSILADRETYELELARDVVLTPVHARTVSRPEQCGWTSYRATAGVDSAPEWLSVDRLLENFGEDRDFARSVYRRFVDDGIAWTRRPLEDVVGQIYLGPHEWLQVVRTRIASEPRDTEHPIEQRELLRPAISRVVAAVASAFGVTGERIRWERGGGARLAAAWLAVNEGGVAAGEIAAALRIRSTSRITKMVRECESELKRSAEYRARMDRCFSTLRGESENYRPDPTYSS